MDLVDILESRAESHRYKVAYSALKDAKKVSSLTYGELEKKAKAIAAELQAMGLKGGRALLMYPSGIEFISAFWGCILAEVIPVPVFTPKKRLEHWRRLDRIASDCTASVLLTSYSNEIFITDSQKESSLYISAKPCIVTEKIDEKLASLWKRPNIKSNAVAFLQYTSGSTGNPKGVVVTHDNLIHNQMMMAKAFSQDENSVFVTWLPLYHDMGLIGNVLLTVYLGAECNIMTPASFLAQPYLWLKSISTYKGTASFAPNFAYQLCVEKITDEQKKSLDLSTWEFALNGAEPIRASTLREFTDAFAGCGLSETACYPGYGLAEATLFVTGGEKLKKHITKKVDCNALRKGLIQSSQENGEEVELVSSGKIWLEQEIKVVKPDTFEECNSGEIGEIWLRGPSVAQGYWSKEEESRETFRAMIANSSDGPFMRTGDLGFIDEEGNLFVTGRQKELIIIRGRNYYPQDIECTVQEIEALKNSGGAAFSIDNAGEKLVVVQEVERSAIKKANYDELFSELREKISRNHDIHLFAAVFIKPASLPKTSSGKIQRRKVRNMFLEGELAEIASKTWDTDGIEESIFQDRKYWFSVHPNKIKDEILKSLKSALSGILDIPVESIENGAKLCRYGLDSLRAARLQYELGISLEYLLGDYAVIEISKILENKILKGELGADIDVERTANAVPEGALSLSQQSMYYLDQISKGTSAYHISLPLKIVNVDLEVFRRALDELLRQHKVLRVNIFDNNGILIQKVSDRRTLPFRSHDARYCLDSELKQKISAVIDTEIDLQTDPLFRVEHFEREVEKSDIFVFIFHHIAADLFSLKIILNDFGHLYSSVLEGADIALRRMTFSYDDYVADQWDLTQGKSTQRSNEHWSDVLSGDLPVLSLPMKKPRGPRQDFHGNFQDFYICESLTKEIKTLSSDSGATMNMILLSVYHILLAAYSKQQDICIGMPAAGRNKRQWQKVVGYCVNPITVRCGIDYECSFHDHLEKVKRCVREALIHQDYPFPLLVEKFCQAHSPSISPIFQTMFALYPADMIGELAPFILGEENAKMTVGDLYAESFPVDPTASQMDISLYMIESEGRLRARIQYNSELFSSEMIRRFSHHYLQLLDSLAKNPNIKLSQCQYYSEQEYRDILALCKPHSSAYTAEKLLPQIITDRSLQASNQTALVFENEEMSYGDLERQVNKLANYLKKNGAGPETIIAICMERSFDMVVSILAIMKAGGAYLPIDPDYPVNRIEYIVADARPLLVLSHAYLNNKISCETAPIFNLDAQQDVVQSCSDQCDLCDVTPLNVAYIIYTSGSTGHPKGVANTHAAILNRLQWMQEKYQLDRSDCVLQKTSFGFDVSVWEFLWPLMSGATLLIAKPQGHKDSQYLCELMARKNVTTLHFVPSMLKLFLEQVDGDKLPDLKRVICSGEELSLSIQNKFFELLPQASLHNLYGPTEAAIDVSCWECQHNSERGVVPIGKPIANIALYVLDEYMRPVPMDVPGQLYIGGVGLARAYVNKPGLTADKFVPNPFSTNPGERLYATGDSACYREDGNIEYLGRIDFQVKIRGFRIELGEIESALGKHNKVNQVVAMVHSPESPVLVVYYTATNKDSVDSSELSEFLKKSLPEYMVPSFFVCLDAFPLNASGKVDRKSLVPPEQSSLQTDDFIAPSSTNELQAAQIWCDLLKLERVSLNDNFFSLGGHSLIANTVIARVKTAFAVDISVVALFEKPILSDFVAFIEWSQLNDRMLLSDLELDEGCGQLSFAQERLFFLDLFEDAKAVYNIPVIYRLNGNLDEDKLKHSLQKLVDRHESLRTVFVNTDQGPKAKVAKSIAVSLLKASTQSVPETEKEERIKKLIAEEVHKPFCLEEGPLFRLTLIKESVDEHVLIFNMHHIISDGWSLGILFRELTQIYNQDISGEPVFDNAELLSYSAFAKWQKTVESEKIHGKQLDYWKQQLSGQPALLKLPTDKKRPRMKSYQGSAVNLSLDEQLVNRLKLWSQEESCTLFMTLLAAFKALMMRYSTESDISIGVPVSNRTTPQTEGVVGLFVNTLVIRSKVDENASFREYLKRLKKTVLEAYSNQDIPFEELLKHLDHKRDLSYTPLFQVMFSLQQDVQSQLNLNGISAQAIAPDQKLAKFDLTLSFEETNGGLSGYLEYSTDIFEREMIVQIAEHYKNLLASILEDADSEIASVNFLSENEKHKLLAEWNDTERRLPETQCIHELFKMQAEARPEAIAIQCDDVSISYEELDRRSNSYAAEINRQGVKPDELVGICLERSPELIVGLLGILKAGAAYLPLDANYPQDRLNFITSDAKISLLITCDKHKSSFEGLLLRIVTCKEIEESEINAAKYHFPSTKSNQRAYVNYTSGTTGLPKGTEIEHRSVVRLLFGVDYVNLGESNRVLHASSISFDASTFEIWSALLHGGCCVLLTDKLPTGNNLQKMIKVHGVNTMWLTAPLFNSIVDENAEYLFGLDQLLIGGDALSVPHIEKAQKTLTGTQLINGYGPTESTTFTCCYPIPDNFSRRAVESIPIGKPIGNTKVYILDKQLNPVATNVSGEVFISGDGLARCYSNRSKLTAEVFIPDPFSKKAGARMYRTGDIARFHSDGKIAYTGRSDNQVKIRGFRIEPQEVEVALKTLAEVNEALVLVDVKKTGEKRLVAYVVSAEGPNINSDDIRAQLSKILPEYMMPEFIMVMDRFPLSQTGKVDRRQLPSANEILPKAGKVKQLPTTELEKTLAHIWSELLDFEEPGLHDNFFDLGGHSLVLIRLVARIKTQLLLEVPIKVVFENPTIAQLAYFIESSSCTPDKNVIPFTKVEKLDKYPQSYEQKRLWFLDSLEGGSTSYNVQACWSYQGRLDHELVKCALASMVKENEILRTSFHKINGLPVQRVADEYDIHLEVYDLSSVQPCSNNGQVIDILKESAHRQFSLAESPLFFVQLVEFYDEIYFVLNMHHIITDGWSMEIFIKEFCQSYQALLEKNVLEKKSKCFQYTDYTFWQNEWLKSGVAKQQLDYWRSELAEMPPLLELPTDYPRPNIQSYKGAIIRFSINKELSKQLKYLCSEHACTLYHLLLAAFKVLLAKYSNQSDIAVGTPVANRDREEIEDMIGLFLNTLVIRSKIDENTNLRDLIQQVKGKTIDAFANKDLPFEKIVEDLKPERSLSHSPIFQVMFTLFNAEKTNTIDGVKVRQCDVERWVSKFDLSLAIDNGMERIKGNIEYSTDLFSRASIDRMIEHYQVILRVIANNADLNIASLPILTDQEYRQITEDWNLREPLVDSEACIHDLLSNQFTLTPDEVALIANDEILTYTQLHERANQLAHYLLDQGVGPEIKVGVFLERSSALLVAVLAVLKSGGTYIPLDPNYPEDRIQLIIEDADPIVILSATDNLESRLRSMSLGNTKVFMMDKRNDLLSAYQTCSPKHSAIAKNLAYVIYTSGSTGKPKGVAITHSNAVAMLKWAKTRFLPEELRGVLASTSVCFDLSIFELFLPLISGGKVVLVDNVLELLEMSQKDQVSMINTVPSAMDAILKCQDLPLSIKVVNLAGESLSRKLVDKIYAQSQVKKVYNLYGPSEDTTYSTWSLVTKDSDEKPLIGKAISNTQCYVLDKNLNPVPTGVYGELYLGGEGVSRGYLGRPGMTADRYIPSSFANKPGQRLYKTGDVVRFLSNGEIEYIGRNDNQVKLRGFRIELGEIETYLSKQRNVEDAALRIWKDKNGEEMLIAYTTSKDGIELSEVELKNALIEKLPHYMIPSRIAMLDKMPLTSNGKIDRKALPEPKWSEEGSKGYKPESATEISLAAIWQELLEKDIEKNSDFFELGGHSLLVVHLNAKMTAQYGFEISMKDVFQNTTLEALADFVDSQLWVIETKNSHAISGSLSIEQEFESGEL